MGARHFWVKWHSRVARPARCRITLQVASSQRWTIQVLRVVQSLITASFEAARRSAPCTPWVEWCMRSVRALCRSRRSSFPAAPLQVGTPYSARCDRNQLYTERTEAHDRGSMLHSRNDTKMTCGVFCSGSWNTVGAFMVIGDTCTASLAAVTVDGCVSYVTSSLRSVVYGSGSTRIQLRKVVVISHTSGARTLAPSLLA